MTKVSWRLLMMITLFSGYLCASEDVLTVSKEDKKAELKDQAQDRDSMRVIELSDDESSSEEQEENCAALEEREESLKDGSITVVSSQPEIIVSSTSSDSKKEETSDEVLCVSLVEDAALKEEFVSRKKKTNETMVALARKWKESFAAEDELTSKDSDKSPGVLRDKSEIETEVSRSEEDAEEHSQDSSKHTRPRRLPAGLAKEIQGFATQHGPRDLDDEANIDPKNVHNIHFAKVVSLVALATAFIYFIVKYDLHKVPLHKIQRLLDKPLTAE